MKKSRINSVVCVILTLALVFFNFAGLDLGMVEAHAEQQLKGEGTENSPYEISDYDMLKKFSDIVNGRNGNTSNPTACAILIKDIVCTDKLWNPIGYDDSNNISIEYTGRFDGQGYVIKGLSNEEVDGIDSKDYQGLFGYNAGEVKKVGLQDTNILGKKYVGGVAGWNDGSITCSYNTGAVTGQTQVGGVAGWNDGSITCSYNTGAVTGQTQVGGVAGLNSGSITGSYNTGAVTGQTQVGGVAGENFNSITNSYNTGAVTGQTQVGGVVGRNEYSITNSYNTGAVTGRGEVGGVAGWNKGSITNSYNIGAITGQTQVGGVIGSNESSGDVKNCYYDKSICGDGVTRAIGTNTGNAENVEGLTTGDMTGTELKEKFRGDEDNPWLYRSDDDNNYFYPHLNGVNFEFKTVTDNSGDEIEVKDWPARRLSGNTNAGTEDSPYEISDYNMLKQFSDIVNGENGYISNRGACAILTNDIVCTDKLWNPIGYDDSRNSFIEYTGQFDGQGYVIKGLSNAEVNSITSKNYQGLFGYNKGVVENVGLQDTNIFGCNYVGGVAGKNAGSITEENSGSITNSYNTGAVTGQGEGVGGVAGGNDNIITNSYNTGAVTGQGNGVGGVAGYSSIGSITGSYNMGAVTGQGNGVGGVVGMIEIVRTQEQEIDVFNVGSITGSYNTGAVTGQTKVGGVIGGNGGLITNVYNMGEVNGQGEGVGGVAGENLVGITNSYNTGTVIGQGNKVGGVAGKNDGLITDSYNTGAVIGQTQVGGVVGENPLVIYDDIEEAFFQGRSISNSYNTGAVTGQGDVGGVVGYNASTSNNN